MFRDSFLKVLLYTSLFSFFSLLCTKSVFINVFQGWFWWSLEVAIEGWLMKLVAESSPARQGGGVVGDGGRSWPTMVV